MGRFAQVLLLVLNAAVAHADRDASLDLIGTYKSGRYNCAAAKQVKMMESEDGKIGEVPAVCLYDVTCAPKTGQSGLNNKKFFTHCKLEGDNCKDLSACIAEDDTPTPDKSMVWTKGKLAKKNPAPETRTKFGEQCKYSWGDPYVVYRQHPKKPELWDTVCASPITGCVLPESVKGSFLATCKATGETQEGDTYFMLCPPPQDCLANAIPVKPALTTSEAKALAASAERDQKKSQVDVVSSSVVNASLVGTPPTHKK